MGGSGQARLSKNQRRDQAREKARALREQQKKRERRNRVLLQGGIIVAALAIVGVVALVIVNSIRPPSPGPANMESDGIQITSGFAAVATPPLAADAEPVPAERQDGKTQIEIYLDYQCPVCQVFEQTNGEAISTLIENDAATVVYKPVAILDSQSAGSQYSSRSANAAACVANFSPDSYYDFNAILFENQPAEGGAGLTDQELIGLTEQAGVTRADDVADCINGNTYENWVLDVTDRATSNPDLVNAQGGFGTPTVLVNGERYEGAPNDATGFLQFVTAAESEDTAPTPSPSPSA